MSRVRGKDTKPEMAVRRMLHQAGYRFRLHRRDLPGTPDLVFPSRKTAVFVHGCFWHRHEHCRRASTPKTRVEFWKEKFHRNVQRDRVNQNRLEQAGWKVIIVWECETTNLESLGARLRRELGMPGISRSKARIAASGGGATDA